MPIPWLAITAPTATGPGLSAAAVVGPYMAVFFIAFAVTIIATPFMRILAVQNGIIDWPDHQRKAHLEPIAYLGGVGLLLGWVAGVVALYFVAPPEGAISPVDFRLSIVAGAIIVTATGLADDVYGLSPRVKVGGQLFAAAALTWGGVATGLIDDSFALLGVQLNPTVAYTLATAFITLLVVGGCNAMNLLDGLDGLAAGVAIIAVCGFLYIAINVTIGLSTPVPAEAAAATDPSSTVNLAAAARANMGPIIIMSLALLGALLGFLPYNFNPANIFMGDAGSLLLGYLCAANILLFADVPPAEVGAPSRGPLFVLAALIVFGLPICDTALAIFRRKLRGQPIFSPDNQHMHHLLVRAGFGVKKSVLIMYSLALFFAVLGCVMAALNTGRFALAVFCVVFGFVAVTAYKVGHQQVLRDRRLKAGLPGDLAAPAGPEPNVATFLPPSAETAVLDKSEPSPNIAGAVRRN
jgi:UDP-GlcNAc:undecaprenyl-phosphate GlcNAc-1-phosphate transferase